jgi:hypothetical protein
MTETFVGLHARHGRGDQVLDRDTWPLSSAALQGQHDRSGRLGAVAREQFALRHHEMHAGRRTCLIERMVRGSSPSSARIWLICCTKLVVPSASARSKIS